MKTYAIKFYLNYAASIDIGNNICTNINVQ